MKALLCSVAIALFGCAAPQQPVWYRDNTTTADFERDKNRCIYEANLATAGYSQGQTARTQSGAIAQGFGEGMAVSMRQNELYRLCMTAAGYTQGRNNDELPGAMRR